MFKNFIKMLTGDCEVLSFKGIGNIYPIYKNGSSSLYEYAKQNSHKKIKNNDINDLDVIEIFVRDPYSRFISGVNTYIELNKSNNENEIVDKIQSHSLPDRHLMPQIVWLFHLCKFFKGTIILRDIKRLHQLIPQRLRFPKLDTLTQERLQLISKIDNAFYVEPDSMLAENLDKKINIMDFVQQNKNVLS